MLVTVCWYKQNPSRGVGGVAPQDSFDQTYFPR